jgi:hypothetical protein
MLISEKEIIIPRVENHDGLLEYASAEVLKRLPQSEIPVRFVITHTSNQGYLCELGILSEIDDSLSCHRSSIFDYKKRSFENVEKFNAVLLIPTGIGAEIGGHSGDGGPVARLLASICDNLITHPNVVNAADINELPENALYVEGSVLSRLLMGTIGLQKVRSNRIMLVIDKHHDEFFHEAAINSVSAARAAFGIDCPVVVKMSDRVLMRSLFSGSGRAAGRIEYLECLCEVLEKHRSQYDAVALSSLIEVPSNLHEDYYRNDIEDMVNPWGGVEAMLTHTISLLFDIPSAHSPMMESKEILNLDVGVVDPRKSAEVVSTTYLHCILKGLHKSPRIINNPLVDIHSGLLTVTDISCLVIPDGCIGLPTLAALEQGIPVIAVKENRNLMRNKLEELPFSPGKLFVVDNYLEAVGVMNTLKAGIAVESVRRPLAHTTVYEDEESQDSKTIFKTSDSDFTE